MLTESDENEITNPLRGSTDSKDGLRRRKSGDKRTVSVESTYGPDPPDGATRKSVLRNIAFFILVTEFCERVAYYGFAGSLVLFFQKQLGLTNAEADVQFSAWSGICYVTPLLGGYIADTYLGRYHTILIFCLIYLAGLLLVVIECVPGDTKAPLFYLAIYIIALGTGGIKPNVSTLGADQFDERYARDRRELMSFFNWFYWMVNLGALIAYSLIAYLCQYGLPSAGGETWGFFLGYTVPCCTMFAGICIFVAGTPLYKRKAPSGSVLSTAAKIVYEAVVTRYHCPRPPPRIVEIREVEGEGENQQQHQGEEQYKDSNALNNSKPAIGHILDKASVRYGGSFPDHKVQGVKLVARLLPFLAVLIPFWGIYSQMSTAFQNQACQMDLDLGAGVQMPVAALNSFDTIAILCLVPVFDVWLYPQLGRWLQRPVTMLEKIGAGFFVAILAMLVAAFVEIARVQYAPPETFYTSQTQDTSLMTPCQSLRDYNPFAFQHYLAHPGVVYADDDSTSTSAKSAPLYCSQTCNTYVYNNATDTQVLSLDCISCDALPLMSSLSVFWQVPQFCLIGVAEILASITSLEFFYSQAPTAMRSVSQSLNLATTAAGSFLVIPLLLLVNSNPAHPWVPANLDEGHLAYYFFLLAALMGATLLVFIYISATYTYQTSAELSLLDDDHQPDDRTEAEGEGVDEEVALGFEYTYAKKPQKSGAHSASSSRQSLSGLRGVNPLHGSNTANTNTGNDDSSAYSNANNASDSNQHHNSGGSRLSSSRSHSNLAQDEAVDEVVEVVEGEGESKEVEDSALSPNSSHGLLTPSNK